MLYSGSGEALATPPPPAWVTQFEAVATVGNPNATNYVRAVRLGERVLHHFANDIPVEGLLTVPGGYQPNAEVFDNHAGILTSEKALLILQAGDGGLQLMARWMIEHDSRATILALPGGNACDLSRVTLGSLDVATISRNLSKLRTQPLFPLISSTTDENGDTHEQVGLSNWSAGVSGRVARALNSDYIRRHPFIQDHKWAKLPVETMLTLATAANRNEFMVKLDPNREPLTLRELLASNMPVMAKVGRLAVRAHAPQAFVTAIGPGTYNPLSTAYLARKLTTASMDGILAATEYVEIDGTCHQVPLLTVDAVSTLIAQMDGEPFVIPAGSTTELAHSQRPLSMLSLAA